METQDEMIGRFQALFRHDNATKMFDLKDDNAKYGTVTGHIIGYRLDNACGDHVEEVAVIKGFQEYVLSVEVFTNNNVLNPKNHFETELFNMTNMIAAIRANANIFRYSRNREFHETIYNMMLVTKDCRNDMHEPDEQAVSMTPSGSVFQIGSYPNNTDLAFTFVREHESQNFDESSVTITIEMLLRMMLLLPTT